VKNCITHTCLLVKWALVPLDWLWLLSNIFIVKIKPKRIVVTNARIAIRLRILSIWIFIIHFQLFQKKKIVYSLFFIVLYRFAEGQAIKIIPLFFKAPRQTGGLGLSTAEIGMLYGVFGAIAFVLGSIAAGYFVSKTGLTRKSLLILCCFFNIPFVAYTCLAIYLPNNLYIIGAAVAIEYFGYGFGFVGLILFIMQQIAPGKYKMAHYAFGSGLVSLGFLLPSMVSGFVSDWLGYKDFFIWVLFSTIPSFLVTWLVPLQKFEENNN